MNKIFSFIVVLIVLGALSFSQSLRNPQFRHSYEPEVIYDRQIPDIEIEIIENVIADNDQLKVKIVWYKGYNQANFTVIGPKIAKYDESQYEKAFFETIEKWILDPNHRYYSYNVIGRNHFFSRKDPNTDKPIITAEYRVSLLK